MNSTPTPPDRDPVAVHPPVYPMLARVVRYGDAACVVLLVTVLMIGLAWAWQASSPWGAVAGCGAAALVYLFARIAVELVRLVCDMLLPK